MIDGPIFYCSSSLAFISSKDFITRCIDLLLVKDSELNEGIDNMHALSHDFCSGMLPSLQLQDQVFPVLLMRFYKDDCRSDDLSLADDQRCIGIGRPVGRFYFYDGT